MNTAEIYGAIGGVLALAGIVTAALWQGVLVASLTVRVVPPWQRRAPEREKGAARRVSGDQGRAPNGQFLPKVVPDGQKAS